jgi:hypothetical protein
MGTMAISALKKYVVSKALTEEGRQKFVVIAISIFMAIFIIISAIIYIITNPFSAIKQYFSADNMGIIEEFHNEYGYEQTVDTTGDEYIDSSTYDFSNVTFTDNEVDVIYFNQADARWKYKPYGLVDTIGECGCGPTSLAIVISTLTQDTVNPVEMANWSYKNGYCVEYAGSSHHLIPDGARNYGLMVEGATNDEPERIIKALSEGKLIIAIMGKGHFTKSGHFLVMRGITAEGKVLVADPISLNKSNKEWDLQIFLNEAKRGAAAKGPFWIISKEV